MNLKNMKVAEMPKQEMKDTKGGVWLFDVIGALFCGHKLGKDYIKPRADQIREAGRQLDAILAGY